MQIQIGVGSPNYVPGDPAYGTVYKGVYTQTGGINLVYTPMPVEDVANVIYNTLQVGYSNGGYGEYDMSGGSVVQTSLPWGQTPIKSNVSALANAGTGVFNQTGGSVGSLGVGGSNNAVGLTVGGDWIYNPTSVPRTLGGTNYTSVGTYTLGSTSGTGSPLFVGGVEAVGARCTGAFNQCGGTNVPRRRRKSGCGIRQHMGCPLSTTTPAPSCSAGMATKPQLQREPGAPTALTATASGTDNLSGGLLTSFNSALTFTYGNGYASGIVLLGLFGTGIFTQSGGSNIVGYSLSVGGPGGGASSFVSNAATQPSFRIRRTTVTLPLEYTTSAAGC